MDKLSEKYDLIIGKLIHGTIISQDIDITDEVAQLEAENDAYYELLHAVVQKHNGETRHETALRYIQERENRKLSVAAHEGNQQDN